jgi:hypothetical protein
MIKMDYKSLFGTVALITLLSGCATAQHKNTHNPSQVSLEERIDQVCGFVQENGLLRDDSIVFEGRWVSSYAVWNNDYEELERVDCAFSPEGKYEGIFHDGPSLDLADTDGNYSIDLAVSWLGWKEEVSDYNSGFDEYFEKSLMYFVDDLCLLK